MTDQTKHRKEIKKMLEVEFTPEEISQMGIDLAHKTGELRTAEDHKKSVVSQLKAGIDTLIAETNELSNKINSGHEYRNVKCEVEYDYSKNYKTIIRLDNAVVIYEGEIPDDERQIEMSVPDEPDKIDLIAASEGRFPEDEPNDTGPEQTDGDAPQTEESEEQESKPNPLIAEGNVN